MKTTTSTRNPESLLRVQCILVLLLTADVIPTQSAPCNPGEYIINGECCPMCGSGYRVHKHCTSVDSTACLPCVSQSYMAHPNGLTECFPCKSCDSGGGFYVKDKCTYTKNAVCGCMEGYYCAEQLGTEDCDFCERHKSCDPGSFVKTLGTERSDTVCEKCPNGTFSKDHMSATCAPWTSCHSLGEVEEVGGTRTSDALCRKPSAPIGVIVGVVVIIGLLITGVICGIYYFRSKKNLKCCPKKDPKRRDEEAAEPLRARSPEGVRGNTILPIQETSLNPDNERVPANNPNDAALQEREGDTNG